MQASFTHRVRAAMVALALVAASITAAAWAQGTPSNTLSVTAAQVQGYLQQEFPRKFHVLEGLVSMTVSDPQFFIPIPGNRVQMQFDVSAGDQALGRVWLSSALRYDPQTMALFLDEPAVDRVVPRQGEELHTQDRQLVSLLLQDYASNQPLYHLDSKLLTHLGNVRVDAAKVENGRILVQFDQPVGMPDLNDVP